LEEEANHLKKTKDSLELFLEWKEREQKDRSIQTSPSLLDNIRTVDNVRTDSEQNQSNPMWMEKIKQVMSMNVNKVSFENNTRTNTDSQLINKESNQVVEKFSFCDKFANSSKEHSNHEEKEKLVTNK